MVELLTSDDPVRLDFLKTLLEEAGLHPFIFGGVAPYPGALPSRLMAPTSEAERARRLIAAVEKQGEE